MKIAISTKIHNGAWGGGNNFLSNLFEFLKKKKCSVYFDLNQNNIDIILMMDPRPQSVLSTFTHFQILDYIKKNKNTIVVHRINECDERKGTKNINKFLMRGNDVADHTVFISSWLKSLFLNYKNFENSCIIFNGANRKIFNSGNLNYSKEKKFKLVTHHWSNHINKGFNIYKMINDKLNEEEWKNKIELTIIGNKPKNMSFNNCTLFDPLEGKQLAETLKNNHAYITATINEPAGMHHIEGACCGLPLLYINSGALPDYCHNHGIEFDKKNLFDKILEMIENYSLYRHKMNNYQYNSNYSCSKYYDLFVSLLKQKNKIINNRKKIKISILSKLFFYYEKYKNKFK